EVIVSSGSVKMKKADGISYIRLAKGDIGIASVNSRGLVKRKNNDDNYLSWMTGNFNFKATPLSEVFTLLEEKYNVEIEVNDSSIYDCKYTSDFEERSIDDILTIISRSLNFEMKKEGNTYKLTGEGCN
ncbi:MAG: DUF4974 domain-containing protein, partial [Cyclobacteriaceae bacterium]